MLTSSFSLNLESPMRGDLGLTKNKSEHMSRVEESYDKSLHKKDN